MSYLSAHADYRHADYFFARTQSRALSARDWEHSQPLHSWSEIVYPGPGFRWRRHCGVGNPRLGHAHIQGVFRASIAATARASSWSNGRNSSPTGSR
jgi:hypothetical protein